MIVADDLGWGDVSFHGSSQARTPDIDDLASNGIVLNNYYVSPICTPSRGALLSGRHPIHTGLQHSVIQGEEPYGLPLKYEILPQYLKRLGYSTHAIGKWHIGHYSKQHMPTSRGFDSFFGYLIGQEDYYDHVSLQGKYWGMDLRRNLDGVAEKYFGEYSTTMYTREALDVISHHNESTSGPLFMYLCYQAVHVGNAWSRYQVPEEVARKFDNIADEKRRKMVAMGNALNDAVAEVIIHLKETDLLENSIIVFTTDNGGEYFPNGGAIYGSNWPLRGAKWTLWEGGIKANGLIWSPLLNHSAYTYNGLMHITDWVPTLFAAAGGDVNSLPSNLYGKNLWPNLMGGTRENFLRKEVLHNIDDEQNVFAIRYGDFKLKSGTVFDGASDGWYLPPGEKPGAVTVGTVSQVSKVLMHTKKGFRKNPDFPIIIKCGEMKSPCNILQDKVCLFNITNDPCEYNNLAKELPEVVNQIMQAVDYNNKTAVKPGNVPADPKSNPALNGYYWGPWIDS